MEKSPVRHPKRPYHKDRESGNYYDRRGGRRDDRRRGMLLATDLTCFANSFIDSSPYHKRRRSTSPSSRSTHEKYTHVDRIDSQSLREYNNSPDNSNNSSISFKEASHKNKRNKPRDRDSDNLYHRFGGKKDTFEEDSNETKAVQQNKFNDQNDERNSRWSGPSRHRKSSRSPSKSPQPYRRNKGHRAGSTSPSRSRLKSRDSNHGRSAAHFPVYDDQNPSTPPSEKPNENNQQDIPNHESKQTSFSSTHQPSQILPDDRGKIKISLSGRRNPKEIPKGPSAYERPRGRNQFQRYNNFDSKYHKNRDRDRDQADFKDWDHDRDQDLEKDRDQERDSDRKEDREEDRDQDRDNDRLRESDRDRDRDRNRDRHRHREQARDYDRKRDYRDYKDRRDFRDSRSHRDDRDFGDKREARNYRDSKGYRDSREPRDHRNWRDRLDQRDTRDTRPSNDPSDLSDVEEDKSANQQVKTYTDDHPDEAKTATVTPPLIKKAQYGVVEYASESVYKRISQIGEGTYGKVYKAVNAQNEKMVALKRLRMESERDGFPITAMREIKLLQSLRHPNIVSLVEMMVEKSQVYMVFEYLDHDLAGILSHPQLTFSEGNIKYLFKQMVEGLAYLHHRGILHRDIKGSNILLSNTGLVKIADFGLARSIDLLNPDALYTNRVITLWYRPPELLLGATKYNGAADMWGLGCILAEFFVRKALFQAHDEIGQIKAIYSVMGTPLENGWPEAVELPWYQLIPPKEPRLSQFVAKLAERIPKQAVDLILKLLTLNPKLRYTAEQTLQDAYFSEEPKLERPVQLESLTEEWHDFEAKQRRRKKKEGSVRPVPKDDFKEEPTTDTKIETKDE